MIIYSTLGGGGGPLHIVAIVHINYISEVYLQARFVRFIYVRPRDFSIVGHILKGEIRYNTVQIFNSCNSRPDVCQCLVVQTTMDDMSIISAKDINDTRNLQIKASFSFEVIHASKHRKLGCNRACGWVLCLGRPRI